MTTPSLPSPASRPTSCPSAIEPSCSMAPATTQSSPAVDGADQLAAHAAGRPGHGDLHLAHGTRPHLPLEPGIATAGQRAEERPAGARQRQVCLRCHGICHCCGPDAGKTGTAALVSTGRRRWCARLAPRCDCSCLAPALGPAPAAANPVKSLYTTVELKSCKQVKRHRDGGAWRCEGLPGCPVYVAEGDLRQFVSAGADARDSAAPPRRRSGAFNTIFEKGSDRPPSSGASIAAASGKFPYAIIVRFHTSQRRPQGRRAGGVQGDADAKPATSPTSTRWPTPTPSPLRAASPTPRRAASIAARSRAREGATGRSPM